MYRQHNNLRAPKEEDNMMQFCCVPVTKPNATTSSPAVDPPSPVWKTNVITASPGVIFPSSITPTKRKCVDSSLVSLI